MICAAARGKLSTTPTNPSCVCPRRRLGGRGSLGVAGGEEHPPRKKKGERGSLQSQPPDLAEFSGSIPNPLTCEVVSSRGVSHQYFHRERARTKRNGRKLAGTKRNGWILHATFRGECVVTVTGEEIHRPVGARADQYFFFFFLCCCTALKQSPSHCFQQGGDQGRLGRSPRYESRIRRIATERNTSTGDGRGRPFRLGFVGDDIRSALALPVRGTVPE